MRHIESIFRRLVSPEPKPRLRKPEKLVEARKVRDTTSYPGRAVIDLPRQEIPLVNYAESIQGYEAILHGISLDQRKAITLKLLEQQNSAPTNGEKRKIKRVLNLVTELFQSAEYAFSTALAHATNVRDDNEVVRIKYLAGDFFSTYSSWQILQHLEEAVNQANLEMDAVIDCTIRDTSLLLETGFQDMSLADALYSKEVPAEKTHLLVKFLLFATQAYENLWPEITVPDYAVPEQAFSAQQQENLLLVRTEKLHSILNYLLEMSFSHSLISLPPELLGTKDFYLNTVQFQNVLNKAVTCMDAMSQKVYEQIFDSSESGKKVRDELNMIFQDTHLTNKIIILALNINNPGKLLEAYRRSKDVLSSGLADDFLYKFFNLIRTQIEENKDEIGVIWEEESDEYFEVLENSDLTPHDFITDIQKAFGKLHGSQGNIAIKYTADQLQIKGIKNFRKIEIQFQTDGKNNLLFVNISADSGDETKIPLQALINLNDPSGPYFDWNILAHPSSVEYHSEVILIHTLILTSLQKALHEFQQKAIKEERSQRAQLRKSQKTEQKQATWKQSTTSSSNQRLIEEVRQSRKLKEVKVEKRILVELPSSTDEWKYKTEFLDKVTGKRIAREILDQIYTELFVANQTGLFNIKPLTGQVYSRLRLVLNGTHYRVVIYPSGADARYSRHTIHKIFIRNDEDEYDNL